MRHFNKSCIYSTYNSRFRIKWSSLILETYKCKAEVLRSLESRWRNCTKLSADHLWIFCSCCTWIMMSRPVKLNASIFSYFFSEVRWLHLIPPNGTALIFWWEDLWLVRPVTREGLTNKDLRRLGLIIYPSGVGQQLANEACKREDLHLKWLIKQALDCH